jgi:hypothetical protein
MGQVLPSHIRVFLFTKGQTLAKACLLPFFRTQEFIEIEFSNLSLLSTKASSRGTQRRLAKAMLVLLADRVACGPGNAGPTLYPAWKSKYTQRRTGADSFLLTCSQPDSDLHSLFTELLALATCSPAVHPLIQQLL